MIQSKSCMDAIVTWTWWERFHAHAGPGHHGSMFPLGIRLGQPLSSELVGRVHHNEQALFLLHMHSGARTNQGVVQHPESQNLPSFDIRQRHTANIGSGWLFMAGCVVEAVAYSPP